MSTSKSVSGITKTRILTSTAVLIGAIMFLAGLLIGSLANTSMPTMQRRSVSDSAPQESVNTDDHIAQARQDAVRNPQELRTWVHLGNLYYQAGQPTQAIEAYEHALSLQPGNADVMTDMATMYRDAGQPEHAIKLLDQVISANVDHQNAHFNKGIILMINMGRPQEAVAAWKILLRNIPDASMGKDIPLNEALPMLITEGGTILEDKNNLPAALQAFDLALQENPTFEPALSHKAFALEQLGRQIEAKPIWMRLLEINPEAMSPDGRKVSAIVNKAVGG